MTRINIILINFLIFYGSLVSLVASDAININTPSNPVIVGSTLTITWNSTTTLTGTGDLRLMITYGTNMDIDGAVDLTKLSYPWVVNATPGVYFFGLFTTTIAGQGAFYSNNFTIADPPKTVTVAPVPVTVVTPVTVTPTSTNPAPKTISDDTNTKTAHTSTLANGSPDSTASTATQTVVQNNSGSSVDAQSVVQNNSGSSVSEGVIIGAAVVVGAVALAVGSIFGFRYYRKKIDYIPTPGGVS